MYKVEHTKIQKVLNYLQTQPYRETVQLAEALINSREEYGSRLIEDNLYNAVMVYLQQKPLGAVYDVINEMKTWIEDVTVKMELPDNFDAQTSNISENKIVK